MRFRAYIERGEEAHTAFDMVAAHVATLGKIVQHTRLPYWKIVSLDECLWVVHLTDEPSLSVARATSGIASGWVGTSDWLCLDRSHSETFHPALSSLFVELEPDDWARHAGVAARFGFGDRVCPLSGAPDWLSAIVVGRSFDNSTGWGYALQTDPTSHVFCTDEADLRPYES